MSEGKFKPTWESLQQYKVPDWYRMPGSGYGPLGTASQPEPGERHGRLMYDEGNAITNGMLNITDIRPKQDFRKSNAIKKV
jgi:hypothetical protein